ncbi:MAG: hypothetical protein M0P77_10740, partial [Firmicutes bacterium]|nr:hypothetical protein [Bacillota bacterium]
VPGFVSSGMYEAIKYWNRAYKEELLPDNYYGHNGFAQLTDNNAGIACGNSNKYWLNENSNKFAETHEDLYGKLPHINGKEQNVNDVLGEILPLKKDNNSERRWPEKLEQYINVINSKIEPEKIERILDFYEWTITQEGTDVINYGIKGKDYTIDSTGKVQKTEARKLWDKYPSSLISQIVSHEFSKPTEEKTPDYPAWMLERRQSNQQIKDIHTLTLNADIYFMLYKIDSNNTDMFNPNWYESRLNTIIYEAEGKSIEEGWNDFLDEVLNTKDGREYINKVNAQIF